MGTASNPTKKSTAAVVAPLALGVVSLAAVFGGVSTIVAANASGSPADQVPICHATGSQSNPYNQSSVDTSSIDNYKKSLTKKPDATETPTPTPTPSESPSDSASPSASDNGNGNGNNAPYLNGHGDHTGPVFAPGISTWGDIIPPFTSAKGTIFLGYNWTPAGQAILNNDCNYTTPTPTDSGSATPTESISPTSTPTTSGTPNPTGSGSGTPTTSGSPNPTGSGSGTPASTPPTVTGGGTTGGAPAGGGTAPETGGGVPGVAVETVAPEVVAPLPGTVAMPAPLAVSPGTVAGIKVTAVPAGNGELALSLAGITLLGGGIAGISGSAVWFYDRRRKTT